jgi:pimeloyl-ACP methyl ester carboxylesterase
VQHPAFAILWEIWAAHRRGFVGLAAAIPACAMAARLMAAPGQNFFWSGLAVVLLGFCLLALFVFFTFTETSREHKLAVFPVRLFALPVKTGVLVATPMLSGAVVVTVFYLAWAKLVVTPLGEAPALVRPGLILATGLTTYTAIMWGMARLRLCRLFLCGLIGVLLVWELIFPEALLPDALARVSLGWQTAIQCAGLVVLNSGAFLWARVAVEGQRHERMRSHRAAAAQSTWQANATKLPFRTSAQAQCWMEWRRNGRLLPGGVILFALLAISGLPMVIEFNGANTLTVAGWMILFPIAMATLLGKSFAAADFWSQDMTVPPFLAIRPQSCGDIVFAKIRTAAFSAGLGVVLLLSGLVMVLVLWGDNSLVRQGWQEFRTAHSSYALILIVLMSVVALALLTWRQLVVSLYVGLFGKAGVFATTVIASFAVYFVGLPWLVNWALDEGFLRWESRMPWRVLLWATAGIFSAKMWLAWWGWSQSHRRGLLTRRSICIYWLCWMAGTACLAALVLLAFPGYWWVRNCLALLCLLVLPLARPGLAPLALAANRHRTPSAGQAAAAHRLLRPGLTVSVTQPLPRALAIAWPGLAATLSLLTIVAARMVSDHTPGRVDAGDCRLRLLQMGRGSPTIVLESDIRGVIETWWPVQRELARNCRVVSYDRAARGGSVPSTPSSTAGQAVEQLHAALARAKVPPPYLLVGNGLGALHSRIFAHRYPQEVAGLVLLDPPQIETSTEALNWLQAHRAELVPEIQKWLPMFPPGVRGYGIREFKIAEQRLELLPPRARDAARNIRWDEVTDGTLYGMGINFGYMAPGPADEFQRMDEALLEDRSAWPLPAVPVTLITGMKRGLFGNVDRPSLDDFLAEQKLAQHCEWLERLPSARHIVTMQSGGDIPADQPSLLVQSVRQMLESAGPHARRTNGAR